MNASTNPGLDLPYTEIEASKQVAEQALEYLLVLTETKAPAGGQHYTARRAGCLNTPSCFILVMGQRCDMHNATPPQK